MRVGFAIAAVACAFSTAATAQVAGLRPAIYAGVDYQYTSVTWEDIELPTVPPTSINGSELFADSFSGAHLHVGARLTSLFGLELGYMWLPEQDKAIGGGNNSSLRVHGVTLDGHVYFPMDPMGSFELIGLIGGAFLEGTAKLNGPSFGNIVDVDPDWSWRAGGGAQYRINPNLNVRGLVTYQSARFDGEVDHAINVNIGLNYLFD
jgi:hypothetical protein